MKERSQQTKARKEESRQAASALGQRLGLGDWQRCGARACAHIRTQSNLARVPLEYYRHTRYILLLEYPEARAAGSYSKGAGAAGCVWSRSHGAPTHRRTEQGRSNGGRCLAFCPLPFFK